LEKEYNFVCISASIGGIFLKLYNLHLPRMCYERCRCGPIGQ